jgi:Tol biopolymer transport system component
VTTDQPKPRTSVRLDWTLAALSVWLIGGFYVDLWAHAHGRVDDTFFTPWHALLYLGAASFVVVLGAVAISGTPRGVPVRDVLPGPYRMSFLGGLLFGVAGVLDLAWHTVFGFEVNVEALLSPTHLLLATSGMLMLGGPLRSASARLADVGPGSRSWRLAGPFIIPLAMASAVLIAFTQYVNPIVDAWSSAEEAAAEPVAQIYAMAPDGSRQTRLSRLDQDARSARLSPDGTMIIYAAQGGDGEQGQIHAMGADGSGDRTLTTEGENFDPAWSPDGTQIAFSGTRGGEPDLFVMQADGTGIRQLTDDPASDWGPAWSPDGTAIAFNSNRSGTFDLYRIAPDGGDPAALTDGPADDYNPAWAPDGTRIAFTSNRSGDYGLWLVGTAGTDEPRQVATGEGNAYMPSWSPDGARLAFTSNRTGDFEVFVGAATGGEPQNLSRNPGTDDGWAGPAWSPDGSVILYPSQGSVPYWQNPFVRQGFGAAGILVASAVLAGIVTFARRRGPLPFGAFAVLVAVPASMATVLSDEYRFIPAAIAAGVLADLAARAWPPGRTRVGDALVSFLVPALFFAAYFVAVAVTTGIGWSIHLWLGAIAIAGVVGLFLDELARGPAPAHAERPSEDPPARA